MAPDRDTTLEAALTSLERDAEATGRTATASVRAIKALPGLADRENFAFASMDAAATKIHPIDRLFHAVAAQVEWKNLARSFVRRLERHRPSDAAGVRCKRA